MSEEIPLQAMGAHSHIGPSSGTNPAPRPLRPFYRSQSRKFVGNAIDRDPEIIAEVLEVTSGTSGSEPVVHRRRYGSVASVGALGGAFDESGEDDLGIGDTDLVQDGARGVRKETFCTRHKLERGTLSAFRREARNIIDRDLPYILHKDNIIRIWAEKGTSQLVAAANKGRPLLWVSLENFDNKFKYYFQHPYLRLFVCYFIIFCNFLMFAEDPVSHSKREADIPVVGNVFSFIFTKYPPTWYWRLIKVTMWLLAIGCGLIVGKTLIHGLILSRFFRLKMFRANQGSWMVQFWTVLLSLFFFSHAYNVLLVSLSSVLAPKYTITSKMWLSSSTVMKAAACGTWLGDLNTAIIVTDMMLQDNIYPSWAPGLRKFWQTHTMPRILLFWVGSVLSTTVVITVIATDWITWDRLNRDFFATTELSRAFLASFVLVMDLIIVMQDWDFPHFTNTLDVNLPGFHKHEVSIRGVEIEISGKWFNYGLIFLVMLLDLNMWKNQMFYRPEKYGQYTGVLYRVYTVTNETVLATNDPYMWSYDARSQINMNTRTPFIDEDMPMHSQYLGYSMWVKSMAFIPCVVGFVIFFTLIACYGRIKDGGGGGAADGAEDEADGGPQNGDGRACSRRRARSLTVAADVCQEGKVDL